MDQNLPALTPLRKLTLGTFALGVVLAIPLHLIWAGALALAASYVMARKTADAVFLQRMTVLYVVILALGVVDINTRLTNANFLMVGSAFLFVLVYPYLAVGRRTPGLITYRFLPKRFLARDLIYIAISIPLAWLIIKVYFSLNPWMPTQWTLPPEKDMEQVWRLFAGINMVGIWDELFFVNTVFGILRTLFPYRWANAGQSVVYASVLYDMAFTGWGVLIVPAFAWTQGAMFRSSEGLLSVLIVHLIVDFFLFAAIVQHYYPGFSLGWH